MPNITTNHAITYTNYFTCEITKLPWQHSPKYR